VFSGDDLGLGYFERQLGADFQEVLERSGATVEVIRGPDHTFRPFWSHDLLRDALERHLRQIDFLEESQGGRADVAGAG
jgi:hypothetical protein